MAQPAIKTSFASGEWAPKLLGRVDIQKYHAGAAFLRNFFVDYSGGGASTRPGTRMVNQALSTSRVRLIPFQASSTLGYILEFGQNYIRFYSNGAPILEAATTISGATNANPGVITDTAHGYNNGDWIFISGVGGMTQLNGNFFIVQGVTANTFTLTNLFGVAINTTTYGAYTSGGTAQRVYTITSPYLASDLFPDPIAGNPGLKYVQDVTSLIITHPNYAPAILTISTANSWTYAAINFGTTIGTPTGLVVTTTLAAGTFNYAYVVTAVDVNGQESAPSTPALISNLLAISTNAGTNKVAWTAVPGALSYNVYRTSPTAGAIPIQTGVQYGFVGNVTGLSFTETTPGVNPDFSQTIPVVQNPFLGASVTALTLTGNGTYTTVPTITIAPPTTGNQATGSAFLSANTATPGPLTVSGQPGTPTGQTIILPFGVTVVIAAATLVSGTNWNVTALGIPHGGTVGTGSVPTNPVTPTAITGGWTFAGGVNLTWHVGGLLLVSGGSGYTSAPTVTFSAGAATATATIGPPSLGNPGVPGFFQTRLMLAAQQQGPQSYELSQPLSFFNFNISNPAVDSDSISGTIISEELNDIRSLVDVPAGMLALTGHGAWIINGGGGISTATPITPANQSASPQAFNGANDLRPIKINLDILYGTNKGNYVRDMTYNIYANIYTGSDVTVLANHLFFGFFLPDWAWSEEPFKTLWCVRNDGILLSLGYVKEQELIGWARHDTNGQFKSTATVIESIANGNVVDAVYFVIQRLCNDGIYHQFVERMADRYFPYGYEDSWSVDCGLQTVPAVTVPGGNLQIFNDASAVGNVCGFVDFAHTPFTAGMVGWVIRAEGGIYRISTFVSSSNVNAVVVRPGANLDSYTGNVPYLVNLAWTIWQPTTVVHGLQHLFGQTVTGVADGAVVPPTVVAADGSVTLTRAATKITLGLTFTPQLKTLPLDLGEPTVQSKRKKLPAVTLRVADTLGLQVGTSFANVVTVKDFQLNAIPSQSNGVAAVTDLVNTDLSKTYIDGYQKLDQVWQEPGQLCVQQNLPYPATIVAIIPEVTVGDAK